MSDHSAQAAAGAAEAMLPTAPGSNHRSLHGSWHVPTSTLIISSLSICFNAVVLV
ncbi:hypothetical protein C8F04DRAFT_1264424 [Mycena alexandri]|uniref:Uncharacterized protein n=1 Tax=Mycena alexandri TaxID=1745969 RepID=A0AAD6SMH1_9AGAR|nr:hypothetical protein C8F04DRAFT_1264424 [Mycena alexandri]